MGKMIYHIRAANESFCGYRNRADMTLRFEFGEAATEKREVAEYWHRQPGYYCVEFAQGASVIYEPPILGSSDDRPEAEPGVESASAPKRRKKAHRRALI